MKLSCPRLVDGEARVDLAIFDHYKGGVYETRGLARCTDTGNVLVIYCAKLPRGDGWGRDLFARRLVDWNEVVTWPDGVERPRFVSRGIEVNPPSFVK